MDLLVNYVFALSYPPNPIRPLDNQVNVAGEKIFTSQKIGADVTDYSVIYTKEPLIFTCLECHTIDRATQHFGTSKQMYSAPALTLQDALDALDRTPTDGQRLADYVLGLPTSEERTELDAVRAVRIAALVRIEDSNPAAIADVLVVNAAAVFRQIMATHVAVAVSPAIVIIVFPVDDDGSAA